MRYALVLLSLLVIWLTCAQGAPTDASRAAHDVMFPIRIPERDVFEGFETSVPPPGWSAVVNNPYTWGQAFHSPYEGTYFASCEYDETYSGSQDEWLCVDHTIEAGDDCLCFYAFASTYWAIDPYQNYNILVTIDGETVWDYLNDNNGAVTWQWKRHCVDLSEYQIGQSISICFGYQGFDGAEGAFDAVSIGECLQAPDPCCPFEGNCYSLPLAAWTNNGTTETCGAGPVPWNWATIYIEPRIDCDGQPFYNSWATVTSGDYPNSTGGALVFGPFDVTSECNCMDLCHYYEFESGYDGGNVKASTDGGSTWELLRPHGGYGDVLDSSISVAECVAGEEVFTGDSEEFRRDCFDLTYYEGQEIKIGFFFGSDGEEQAPGWYLNRIVLGNGSTPVQRTSWGSIKAMYR